MASNYGKLLFGGANIFGGISSFMSSREQASLLEEQGALTKDDYYRQAALVRESGQRTRAKQTMEYISSGVEIVGTPQLMLKETISKSLAQAGALEVTGRNYERLYSRKSRTTESQGMSQLITSILETGALLI
mgnify:CR=1 FL=1|jgi:hypothetical protein